MSKKEKNEERWEPTNEQLKQLLEKRTADLMETKKRLKLEIEERRHAEKKMKSWWKIFQLAMDNIPLCIFWKDAHSVYLGCNENYAKLIDLPDSSAVVGKSDAEFKWPETETLREFGERAMESNIAGFEVIEEFRADEERTCYWDIGSFPFHDEEGTVIGVLGIMEDISDKIIADRMLAQETNRDGLARIVRELMAELSPSVQALSVSEEILSRMTQDASLYSYIKMVAEETGRIRRVLSKLQRISESGA